MSDRKNRVQSVFDILSSRDVSKVALLVDSLEKRDMHGVVRANVAVLTAHSFSQDHLFLSSVCKNLKENEAWRIAREIVSTIDAEDRFSLRLTAGSTEALPVDAEIAMRLQLSRPPAKATPKTLGAWVRGEPSKPGAMGLRLDCDIEGVMHASAEIASDFEGAMQGVGLRDEPSSGVLDLSRNWILRCGDGSETLGNIAVPLCAGLHQAIMHVEPNLREQIEIAGASLVGRRDDLGWLTAGFNACDTLFEHGVLSRGDPMTFHHDCRGDFSGNGVVSSADIAARFGFRALVLKQSPIIAMEETMIDLKAFEMDLHSSSTHWRQGFSEIVHQGFSDHPDTFTAKASEAGHRRTASAAPAL